MPLAQRIARQRAEAALEGLVVHRIDAQPQARLPERGLVLEDLRLPEGLALRPRPAG